MDGTPMKTSSALALLLGAVTLSACVEPEMAPVTGGDLTGVTATNCRAAIARQTNLSVSDVAIFDVVESEAGNVVQASVAGADQPWICRTDRDGRVGQVMYSGEG
jgi:hypothetical protein